MFVLLLYNNITNVIFNSPAHLLFMYSSIILAKFCIHFPEKIVNCDDHVMKRQENASV